MSWDNYGLTGWHIDHIIPCYNFDLTNPVEQALCFHYSNLQPLWAEKNLSKNKRLPNNIDIEKLKDSDSWKKIAHNSKWANGIINDKSEYKWCCRLCNKRYKLKGSLDRHNKEKHNKKSDALKNKKQITNNKRKIKEKNIISLPPKEKNVAQTKKKRKKNYTQESIKKMVTTKIDKRTEFRNSINETTTIKCTGKYCDKKEQPIANFFKKADSHSGYQPWCKFCINQEKRLHRENIKANQQVWKCDQCDKKFKLKDSVTRHKKEKHKD